MKNKNLKRNKSKKLYVVALLVLGALILTGGYLKLVRDDSAEVSQEQQESAEQADVDSAKQRIEEEAQDEPLKDGTGDDSPVVSGPVTLSGLTFSQSGGLVKSSVDVSGAESGTCTFIFTDGDGRATSETAKLASGGCSISVSEVEFTMLGEYNLTAKFGDKSINKTIIIN